jgi:hypothetical protein
VQRNVLMIRLRKYSVTMHIDVMLEGCRLPLCLVFIRRNDVSGRRIYRRSPAIVQSKVSVKDIVPVYCRVLLNRARVKGNVDGWGMHGRSSRFTSAIALVRAPRV